ncbi:MAG TPA: hypothetical protein VFU17_04805 [Candidatus Limnocylindrales bacterium]|nr:hypothetical protein [Candidatus Limnocylindrales bacterium]
MSLHRRPVGRGRMLAGLSALVLIVGCVLPWFTVGSTDFSLPPRSENAFEGPSIAVFLIAIATLALITLPYASDRPVSFDRWWAYAAVAVVGWIGLGLRMIGVVFTPGGLETITPDRAIGLWVSIVGLALLTRAAYVISREPEYR